MNVHLVIIDPQNDFCNPSGKLYVGGAEDDMSRVAQMIRRIAPKLSAIHVTLDSHHLIDIAHPAFWKNSSGANPSPFTIISSSDVKNGVWSPVLPSLQKRAQDYVDALETSGRYALCIWPPHCLIGSEGQAIVPEVHDALDYWAATKFQLIDFVTKGSNVFTEHYSAVQAEVPDPSDTSTQINIGLIQTLMKADIIAVCGEAGSHCLANTVRDIANNFGDDSYVSKIVLLTDGTSPVTGFESLQTDFIKDMTARGMQLSTTTSFLA